MIPDRQETNGGDATPASSGLLLGGDRFGY